MCDNNTKRNFEDAVLTLKNINERLLPAGKCLLANDMPEQKGGWSKFNRFRSRKNGEMVSSLRDAIFLCPKPMKEKGKLAGGGRQARAMDLFFAIPL